MNSNKILKELTKLPHYHHNTVRNPCLKYQASIIDVGKSCNIKDDIIWNNKTLWNKKNFVLNNGKYEFDCIKVNRILDNRPRVLKCILIEETLYGICNKKKNCYSFQFFFVYKK